VRYPVVLFVLGAVLLTSGCGGDSGPPKAKVEPHEIEKHGHVRVDDYFWLKQRHNPEVIAYLEAENAYTKTVTAQSRALRETLFEEIKGRIKKDDSSVPYRLDGFYYYSRYEEGDEYPYYCRKKGSLDADEQIMLDANELAEGHDYLAVRGVVVTLDTTIMAFAVDTVGRRKYTIRFRDLGTGEFLDDPIVDVTGNIAWANDNKTLFYAKQDPDTLRSYQIWRHTLGTDPADDVLVFQEDDETFSTYVWKTKSRKYVMIGSFQTVSSEVRYLDANEPMGEFTVFLPRERDHEYNIDHAGDEFFIRTNWDATNFRLMKTPVTRTAKDHWTEVIPHRDDVLFEDFELFKDFLTIGERHDGLIQVRIRPRAGGEEHYLDFGEPAYVAYFDDNKEFDTPVLRYGYSSLTTPRSVFDYDMTTREKELKKQDEVLGGFDRENYVSERLHAKARDGANVPISLVYRKGFEKNRSAPLLLYGYGSYGNSIDPSFRSDRLSLIDRGFVFAIAHVRGGEELGRRWYEDGKLFNKKNTFTDFIDCAEYLIERGYAAPDGVFAYGGSAGGLLVGAVINMRPDLFNGAVAAVPFVDVVTTMLDDDIPLTTSEYDEWGDPNKKDYYDYILSYSPYDNVEAKSYPNLLVTTGLHDSQVQYWEPAKWVAKLRATKTDDNVLLLRTNMDAGHGGKSGRFRRYEETAFIYAFLLELADKN
jgi:oligopeptidase B